MSLWVETMNNNYVQIFDTTLRDGEQSPGATLTSAEKLEIARALAMMGVDVMEAGFPAASPDDLEGVRRIAIEVGNMPGPSSQPPIICGLARAVKSDIDKSWEAVERAARPRIHTFLATSPIHMKHKLRLDPEEVVEQVSQMVAYAKQYCQDVEFSPEDAGRSDPEFLYLVVGEAIKAGATTLNIPDTVGYATPEEFTVLSKEKIGIFVWQQEGRAPSWKPSLWVEEAAEAYNMAYVTKKGKKAPAKAKASPKSTKALPLF